MAKIGFKKLQQQLMDKGYSKEEAGNITYSIGVDKYGKSTMTKKAILGRKKAKMK